jgi:hypothetical protein
VFKRREEKANNPVKGEVAPEANMLPTSGGRSSLEPSGSMYSALVNEANLIKPGFDIELLSVCEYLAKYNGDVSYAVDNIVQLGSTPYRITYDDSIKPEQAKEFNKYLNIQGTTIYDGGINSLINDLYAQLAINGALSSEYIPDSSIKFVKSVVLVPPISIRFKYNRTTYKYEPYQALVNTEGSSFLTAKGIDMVKLNPKTYRYRALRRFSDNPTGIPPFISAFEGICIEKDMMANMRCIVKKLGVFGFLTVMMQPLSRKQGESEDAYYGRSLAYIQQQREQVEKGFASGIAMGFKGAHEFNMEGTMTNITGARELFNLISEIKMAGLKQDPLMLGRNFNVAETMARVIMTKLTMQIGNFQRLVASFLEDLFKVMLNLAGYKVNRVSIEFEEPLIGDKLRAEQAYAALIENRLTLRDKGIITQTEVANEAGYEAAEAEKDVDYTVPHAGDIAIKVAGSNGNGSVKSKTDPKNTKDPSQASDAGAAGATES